MKKMMMIMVMMMIMMRMLYGREVYVDMINCQHNGDCALQCLALRDDIIFPSPRQVSAGTDPALMRQQLGRSLPRAPPPEQQTVNQPEILHTTLARLVEQPATVTSDKAIFPGEKYYAARSLMVRCRNMRFVKRDSIMHALPEGQGARGFIPPSPLACDGFWYTFLFSVYVLPPNSTN
jgi:hypothetical protein